MRTKEYSSVIDVTSEFSDVNVLATTFWFSGCKLHCKNCQNQDLKVKQMGYSYDYLFAVLRERILLTDYLVLLGGNPIDSLDDILVISEYAKSLHYKVFVYTGYTIDKVKEIAGEDFALFSKNIDYIKVGDYREELKDSESQYFFASTNQEVMNKNPETCSWQKYYYFDENNRTQMIIQ